MDSINSLKRDHERIFEAVLQFEKLIGDAKFDYINFIRSFSRVLVLISNHENHRTILMDREQLVFLNKNLENHGTLSLESKHIRGHIRVLNESIISRDEGYIKVALDNDGRMLISKIKEHIFLEEMALDRILFLHAT